MSPPTKLHFAFSETQLLLNCASSSSSSSSSYNASHVPPLFLVVGANERLAEGTFSLDREDRGEGGLAQRNIAEIKSHSRRVYVVQRGGKGRGELRAMVAAALSEGEKGEGGSGRVEISHPQDYPELTN